MPFIPLHDDNPRILIQHAWVTYGLILACVLVFLFEVSLNADDGARLIYGLGLIPATLTGKGELHPELQMVSPATTLVTSAFLHGGWLHLLGNMLYLWVFGDNVEDAMGHWRFAVFYLACALAAAVIYIWSDPGSTVPTVGASGAISGVLGAYLVLHPKARVLVPIVFIPLYVPAYLLLIVWFGFQVVSATVADQVGGNVAWWEHIGGFVAGAILVVPFRHKTIALFGGSDLPQGVRLRPRPKGPTQNRPRDPGEGPWT